MGHAKHKGRGGRSRKPLDLAWENLATKLKRQMETPNGNAKLKRSIETPNGNAKLKRQIETPN